MNTRFWYNSPHNALQHLTQHRTRAGSAKEDHVNRNRFIVGSFIGVVVLVVVIFASVLGYEEWKSRQARTGQREPLQRLGYCAPGQVKPCILSFSLDPNGDMLINLLTERSVPDFHLEVRREAGTTAYQCHKTGRFSTSVLCSGRVMPVGETLQFVILSKQDDSLLAEGQLPIIGLALATPEFAATPTSIPFSDRPPR